MKKLITVLLVVASTTLLAQTTQIENLSTFDKLVIEGEVQSVKVTKHYNDRPSVKISGIKKDQISSRVDAGVLYLSVKDAAIERLVVENSDLRRIESAKAVEITGVDFIGTGGNYLITDFHNQEHFAKHIDIDLSELNLGDLDIDLPNIDFDFDFDRDFDIDVDFNEHSWRYSWNWEEHKDEIERATRDIQEEMKRAVKEVKKELKKLE